MSTDNLNQADHQVSSDRPLLLPVISADAATPVEVGRIAEQLLGQIAQRYQVDVAPQVTPAQIEAGLVTWLSRAEQLMFLSFGPAEAASLQTLVGTLHAKLSQAAGREANQRALPLPFAVPDRPVFAPLEGVGCPQGQLAPLVSKFPGWQGTYLYLEAGSRRVVLTCGQPGRGEACAESGASLIISSLAAALCGQEGRLKRDGEILASYFQSLLGAVLRQAFHLGCV